VIWNMKLPREHFQCKIYIATIKKKLNYYIFEKVMKKYMVQIGEENTRLIIIHNYIHYDSVLV